MNWNRLRKELQTASGQEVERDLAAVLDRAARAIHAPLSRTRYLVGAGILAFVLGSAAAIQNPRSYALESVKVAPRSPQAVQLARETMVAVDCADKSGQGRATARAAARLCGLAGPDATRAAFVRRLLEHPSADVRQSAALWYPFVDEAWYASDVAAVVLSILAGE